MSAWKTKTWLLLISGVLLMLPSSVLATSGSTAPAAVVGISRFLRADVSGAITSNTTWTLANSPYIVTNDVTVSSGVTLTIEPAVVVKFNDDYDDLIVDGTLIADGTATTPIIFTSMNDHSVGGNTGTGTPAGADWGGLYFSASSSGNILDYVTVRYGGGRDAAANVHIQTTGIAISNSTFAYGGSIDHGIQFSNVPPTTLSNCTFIDNGYDAVHAVLSDSADSITLSNNHASGNRVNGLAIEGTITGTVTWDWEGSDTLPFVIYNDLTVQADAALSLTPGTALKFYDDYDDLWVNGTLVADGTAVDPIIFTSFKDDTVGGDTNDDGSATSPAGANWSGLYFTPSSSGSTLNYAVVRYGGGRNAAANAHVQTRDIAISNSTFAYGGIYDHGIEFGNVLPATLSDNTFTDNGYDAIHATLTDNAHSITLSNNHAGGNRINGLAVQATLSGTVTWDWEGGDTLPFVVYDDITVQTGAALSLTPGTALKFRDDYDDLWVNGTLLADGTDIAPIIFTSFRDDTVGGDTNDDGSATGPTGADWSGLYFTPFSSDSILNYAIVRYGGGRSAVANVHVQTADITFHNSTVSHVYPYGLRAGVWVDAAAPNLVGNVFQDNEVGPYAANGAQPTLYSNTIISNTDYGVYNATPSRIIDARENWWGDAGGPYHATDNPGGTGDAVTDGVSFSPWIEALAWRAPHYDLLHSTETIAWGIFGRDTTSMSVKVMATGPTQTLTLGEGLDPDGALDWDTTAADDGWYELQAQSLDGGSTIVDEISRDVLVLNGPTATWHAGTIGENEAWDAAHLHLLVDDVTLATGVQVTVEPGSVIKAAAETQLIIEDGATLDAQGTTEASIIFTSLADDTAGGDTNLDGAATVPRPGDWYGIVTEGTGQFTATADTFVRYFQRVHGGALTADQTWEGDVVHRVTSEVFVPSGVRLTIAPDAVVKFDDALGVTVQTGGEVVAQGSLAQPIYFASAKDDALAGDTNLDGDLSSPAPGDWRGILATGGQVILDHAILQYGGGTASGLWSSSAAALATANGGTLQVGNSMIRNPYFEGVIAWGSGDVTITNTVIAGADRGVNSDGSATVRLTHCTLDDNRVGLYGHGGDLIVANTIVANSLDYGVDNVLSSPIDTSYSNVWSAQGTSYYHMTDQTGSNGNISVDPLFKNRTAGIYQLQYVSPMIDAADGTAAPESDYMGSPRYDDPRTDNTGTPTGTGAFADIGAYEFVETAESPIDLVVTDIDAPLSLVAGEWITVSWTIRNDGTEPATGPWHDAVALVQSPENRPATVPVAEVLVGEGVSLAPGDPYEASAAVRVPGATIGEQYWQVTTNAQAEIFEGRYITNNVSLADYPATLDVPILVLDGGSAAGAFIQADESHWFQFTPEVGQNVEISLDLGGAAGTIELFLGTGYVPTRDAYDAQSPEWQLPDSHLSLADAVSTTYYVLVYSTVPDTFEITAATYDFSLTSVSPATSGNTGQVTLMISGVAIPPTSTVTLAHAAAGDIPALATHWIDANRIAATFDLAGVAPGSADVEVAYGSTVRTLAGAFTVEAGGSPDFWWHITGPDLVRSGRLNEYSVTWGNQGNVDAPVYLIGLEGSSLMTLLIPDTGEVIGSGFQYFAMTRDATLPSIPPGAEGAFHFAAMSDGFGDFTLEAHAVSLDDPSLAQATVDWESFRASVKPDELTEDQWNTFFDALITDLGGNWADVGNALAEDALDALREPDAPLFPPAAGVRLRIPLLRAMGRVAAGLGWIDESTLTRSEVAAVLADRAGRLRTLNVTISGFERAFGAKYNLPCTRIDRDNIHNLLTRSAQVLPGNRSAIHGSVGAQTVVQANDIHDEVIYAANSASDKDTLFFYFSGHGRAEQDGSGSFVDALGNNYEYRQFLDDIKNTKAKNVVVVIDACYAGSFIDRVKKHFDLPEYLKDHITVLAASSSSQTSGAGTGRGSGYTSALLAALKDLKNDKNGDGYVSLWEAHSGLPTDVRPGVKVQNPQWYGPDTILRDPTAQSKEGIALNLNQQAPVYKGMTIIKGVSGGAEDPNDKVGGGYGTDGWVQAGQALLYTIHFENIAPEGVPPELVWLAQDVIVTDQLSGALDWSTFALGNLGFNNTIVATPPGNMSYQDITAVDTDANPVMITATLDAQTGLVTWRMHTYDDQTGQLPEDPVVGFLPANDETHTGEGYVTFSIRPKAGLSQGAALYNQASIIFDVNAPIVTNIITHTLDTQQPTSTVTALPTTVRDAAFTVSWSGSDPGGSGIAFYDVYVSDDGAPFALWQSTITETQAVFTGTDDHTYGFYSVATDNVGYRQPAPTAAQATTTVQAESHIYLPLVVRSH